MHRSDCTGRSSQRITIASTNSSSSSRLSGTSSYNSYNGYNSDNGNGYRCADQVALAPAAAAQYQHFNQHQSSSSSSFQDLLLAADTTNSSYSNNYINTSNNSALKVAHASGAGALASPPSIDLDLLLLDRDSVDAFDDHHYHQQHNQQHLHHHGSQPQPHSHHSFSITPSELLSPLPLVRNNVSRHEVTAVQAFLDEWRDDDDASGVDVVGPRVLVVPSSAHATSSARRRGERNASRATVAPSRQLVQPHSDARVGLDASLSVLAPSSAPSAPAPDPGSVSESTAKSMANTKPSAKTKRMPKSVTTAKITSSSTPESTTAAKSTAKSTNKSKSKPVGTREREREEAIQLRKEALQLRQHLEQLRQSVQRAADASAEPPLWKRVAERQHERLLLARMDNQSLRAAVREQKQMAKSLHRVLLNRVAQVAVRVSCKSEGLSLYLCLSLCLVLCLVPCRLTVVCCVPVD